MAAASAGTPGRICHRAAQFRAAAVWHGRRLRPAAAGAARAAQIPAAAHSRSFCCASDATPALAGCIVQRTDVALRFRSPAGYGEYRFPEFRQSEVPGHIQVEMRTIRHLVWNNDRIDDRRTVSGHGFADCLFQFSRLGGLESIAAAGAGARREVGIRKFDSRSRQSSRISV